MIFVALLSSWTQVVFSPSDYDTLWDKQLLNLPSSHAKRLRIARWLGFSLDFAFVSAMCPRVSYLCWQSDMKSGPRTFSPGLILSKSELIATQCFEAVFPLRADWALIGLCWINTTLFHLFTCWYVVSLQIALHCHLSLLPVPEPLTSDFLVQWAWPTSGGINKLSHSLLTLQFCQSVTSTFTPAAAIHFVMYLQQSFLFIFVLLNSQVFLWI